MGEVFDFVVAGAGSAGAVVAARLSEDPTVRVCLLETGFAPPAEELMPAACAGLQKNPLTDWIFDADAGRNMTLGSTAPERSFQPRGKMLGGSSGINYMAYVRGHPGDFNDWAQGGATGWSYNEVLPYFKKSEGCVFPKHVKKGDIVLEEVAHNKSGPLGVSVRNPTLPFSTGFLQAAQASGLPLIDYNGTTRGGPTGGCSHFHTSTKDGKRSSTFHAFLEPAMQRQNLKIVTGAVATKVVLDGTRAAGVEYRVVTGESVVAMARREVVVSCGAYGSPALLLHSGIGPKSELEAVGVPCIVDNPHVGKHMKDHIQVAFFYPAPGIGMPMTELGLSMGPDALRAAGALPINPKDDTGLTEEQRGLKAEAERRLTEWAVEGKGLVASSLYDAVAFYSTGLGDKHTHDAQIACFGTGYNTEILDLLMNMDIVKYFGSNENAQKVLAPEAENVILLANPVQPHSEGEVRISAADPMVKPTISMNYLSDPHDVKVFAAVSRRVFEIAKHYKGLGPLIIPENMRQKYAYKDGQQMSDAMLEDWVRHYAGTVYHPTSTCRIGDVVDPQLRVKGVSGLRVVDASIMPNVISGNTNAPSIMIGEKGAELIARDNGVILGEFVGASTHAKL